MNKLRSDSAFCQLTPEQVDLLEGWLFEERLGYPRVVEKLKAEFGLETSLMGVRRFYKRLDLERSAQSLMDAVEMSGLVVEALKSGTIKPGMLLLANKCAFELMMRPEPPIRKVTALLRAITSAEAHTMKQSIYEKEQAERKEAERVRKVEKEWRQLGQEIEREDEELRQKQAARKKAKQEAAGKAAKENAGVMGQNAGKSGVISMPLQEPAASMYRGRPLPPTLSPSGGEGEDTAAAIPSVVVSDCPQASDTLALRGTSGARAGERGARASTKDGSGAWQPSVVEDAESNEAEEVENRLTPLKI